MSIADRAELAILAPPLAEAVDTSVCEALQSGAVFSAPPNSTAIFRRAVADAITSIEERADLLTRFLEYGPFEGDGDIPPELEGNRLPDSEVTRAIAFIYCGVLGTFQGALAELLAAGEIVDLVRQTTRAGIIAGPSVVFAGDSVQLRDARGSWKKGADMHILGSTDDPARYLQLGVVEVKSYRPSYPRVIRQLHKHVTRALGGARLRRSQLPDREIALQVVQPQLMIAVSPSDWRLPRDFWFEETSGNRRLCTPPLSARPDSGRRERIGTHEWKVTLPWSREAIASGAVELTFWYLGQLGAKLYARGVPPEWGEMSPEQAGQNAAKMMLYYSIRRCTTGREWQRAVGLYNSYGFGYSLGMNFVDADGAREMLWPEDLDQIHADGRTRHGCRIR